AFVLLILVPIVTIYCLTLRQQQQKCIDDITPKVIAEPDLLLKIAVYKAIVEQMAGREIEMARIIRGLDAQSRQRVYDHYLTGPCESYKIRLKSHEN
ncbi:hypothetical protein PMAYCL1PPCAC_13437, partial [Pristionchus mayeri]